MKNSAIASTTILFLLLPIVSDSLADTKLDPLIGIRISQLVTQTILSAPPLPSLLKKKEHHLIPQISYLKAEAGASESDPGFSSSFEGEYYWDLLSLVSIVNLKWDFGMPIRPTNRLRMSMV